VLAPGYNPKENPEIFARKYLTIKKEWSSQSRNMKRSRKQNLKQ
jgi:hypothetical protein